MSPLRRWPLSQVDAFFVAYQRHAGILMQLAAEVELAGRCTRADVETALRHVIARWPPFGQRLRRRVLGLAWDGPAEARVDEGGTAEAWRSRPLDPFAEPPFQAWWRSDGDRHHLVFRAHHAVADGELFFAACTEAVRALAAYAAGARPAPPAAEERVDLLRVLRAGRLLRRGALPALVREVRHQARAAHAPTSTRVAVSACAPGDTALCERRIEGARRLRLQERARRAGTSLPWLCAAAWARVLHARNVSLGRGANPRVSLEVPVNFRAGRPPLAAPGNFISPVVVEGDATAPLAPLARELAGQCRAALRRHAPAAVPLLSWPGRFLPWAVFRRVAIGSAATGYATSHFTWIEQKGDAADDVARLSEGRLRIGAWRAWGPVCLHMGAALLAVADAACLRLLVNTRVTALDAAEAEALADALVGELAAAEGAALAAASGAAVLEAVP